MKKEIKLSIIGAILMIAGFNSYGQDSTSYYFRNRLQAFSSVFNAGNNLYSAYTITSSRANAAAIIDSATIMKSAAGIQVTLNNKYLSFSSSGQSIFIDKQSKAIQVSHDTSSFSVSMLKMFKSFAHALDNAASVNLTTSNGTEVYQVAFGANAMFNSMSFIFDANSGNPISVYVHDNTSASNIFSDVTVTFINWNPSWTSDASFPATNQYLTNNAGSYQLNSNYSSYRLISLDK